MARQGDTRVKRSASSKIKRRHMYRLSMLSIASLFLAFYRQFFLHNTCGSLKVEFLFGLVFAVLWNLGLRLLFFAFVA